MLQVGDRIIVPQGFDEWSETHQIMRRSSAYYPKHEGQVGTVEHYFPRWQNGGNEHDGPFYLVLTEHWSLMIPEAMAERAVKVVDK